MNQLLSELENTFSLEPFFQLFLCWKQKQMKMGLIKRSPYSPHLTDWNQNWGFEIVGIVRATEIQHVREP